MQLHIRSDGRSDAILRWPGWEDLSWLVHGFTTRASGDFRTLPPDATTAVGAEGEGMVLTTARQIHTDLVHCVRRDPAPRSNEARPQADALMTNQPGALLAVRTADCVPLLLIDRRVRAVAAVHAGWRGTLKQVAGRAVEAMRREYGSQPSDLEAVLGPGIGPCCFAVGLDIAEQFHPSFVVSSGLRDGQRPRVHLPEANRSQLIAREVPAGQVWSSQLCTGCRSDEFFSHRREGAEAGRMLALVGIRAEID